MISAVCCQQSVVRSQLSVVKKTEIEGYSITARSSFENLRVYQLLEQMADEIWNIVVLWDQFAKQTVGS